MVERKPANGGCDGSPHEDRAFLGRVLGVGEQEGAYGDRELERRGVIRACSEWGSGIPLVSIPSGRCAGGGNRGVLTEDS